MKFMALALVSGCLLLAGCDRAPPTTGAGLPATGPLPTDSVVVDTPDSERTWTGLLPCTDCQGIDTRLVLRAAAGRHEYQLTETYLGGQGRNSFSSTGSWVEVTAPIGGESTTLVILDPDKSGQRFALAPDGALELLDGSGDSTRRSVDNRLQRL